MGLKDIGFSRMSYIPLSLQLSFGEENNLSGSYKFSVLGNINIMS
jgi:hypothetical protein